MPQIELANDLISYDIYWNSLEGRCCAHPREATHHYTLQKCFFLGLELLDDDLYAEMMGTRIYNGFYIKINIVETPYDKLAMAVSHFTLSCCES